MNWKLKKCWENPLSEKQLNDQLKRHYQEGFNATDVEILQTISWRYFPKWSLSEIEQGRHWQVFGIQGKNKLWYAGSSVCFESVRSVMEYNKLLIKQMIPHPIL